MPKAQGQKTQHKGAFLSPAPLVAGLKYCFYWGFGIMPFFFFFFSQRSNVLVSEEASSFSHLRFPDAQKQRTQLWAHKQQSGGTLSSAVRKKDSEEIKTSPPGGGFSLFNQCGE